MWSCEQGAYLNSTAGAIMHAAIEDAASCAASRCHGHGRCVSLPTLHCDCDPGYLERSDCGQKRTEAGRTWPAPLAYGLKLDDQDGSSIAEAPTGRDIGLEKQLFMDTELLKHWNNVSIVVHRPTELPGGPVITANPVSSDDIPCLGDSLSVLTPACATMV